MAKSIHFFIRIDGRNVPMALTKYTAPIYKRYFRRNLISMLKQYGQEENFKIDAKNPKTSVRKGIRIAQIVWAFAKTGNPKIPSFQKWFDGFNEFPINKILAELRAELLKDVD